MSWRYKSLVQELEKKQSEVEKLSEDFESKLRTKEVSVYIRQCQSVVQCMTLLLVSGGAVQVETRASQTSHHSEYGGYKTQNSSS